jgi:hypothetical protein
MALDELPKNGVITGKVIDSLSKQPIPYATIIIKDEANKTITGGITEESANLYSQKESGFTNGTAVEVTNSSLNFRISNSFTATKYLRFQLFEMYRGGGKSIQFDVDPMWMINTGTSQNILKRKGTITFRINDIFRGMRFGFDSENPYPQDGEFNWESRTAYFGFMYRFGSGKNKKRSRKNRKDNETQGSGFL